MYSFCNQLDDERPAQSNFRSTLIQHNAGGPVSVLQHILLCAISCVEYTVITHRKCIEPVIINYNSTKPIYFLKFSDWTRINSQNRLNAQQ